MKLRRDSYNNITHLQILQHLLVTHFQRPSLRFFVGLIPSVPILHCDSRGRIAFGNQHRISTTIYLLTYLLRTKNRGLFDADCLVVATHTHYKIALHAMQPLSPIIITSHGEDGCRPQWPLYPRNIYDCIIT